MIIHAVKRVLVCCFVLIALLPAEPHAANLREVLWMAAKKVKVEPVATLELLARVESGMNPLAIHLSAPFPLDGTLRSMGVPFNGYWQRGRHHYALAPKSREQAEAVLLWATQYREVRYDVGLLQIYRGNVERRNLDPLKLLDPNVNAIVGGVIFKECHDRYQDFWRAVECYHHGHYKGGTTYYSRNVYKAIQAILREHKEASVANDSSKSPS